jgi:hypothetical protein
LPLVHVGELEKWIEGVKTLDEILNVPPFYELGREFTYEEWDPMPGLLLAKVNEQLIGKPPPLKKQKTERQKPSAKGSAGGCVVAGVEYTFGAPEESAKKDTSA